MNIAKLRKLQQHLQKVPEQFTMTVGVMYLSGDPDKDYWADPVTFIKETGLLTLPPCATAQCLAGETVIMEGRLRGIQPRVSGFPWYEIQSIASDILELTPSQARRLFYLENSEGDGWVVSFVNRYLDAKTPQERVAVAVDYIDFFIMENATEEEIEKEKQTAREEVFA